MPAPTPQSNVERYLSVIAGHGGEIPSEPSSRVEYFLNEIVEGGGIGGKLKPKIVSVLPQIGETGLLYLVPVQGSSGQNTHNEYVWIEEETKFELLGQTKIEFDPSGFVPDTRKIGNVPLSADIPVTLTGDTAITVTNTGTASAIGYSITHADSGVTAGSKGDTTNQTPDFGDTFKVLSATVDAKGHVTTLGEHTIKIPDDVATSQADGLMSNVDKKKLDAISVTATNPLEVTKTGETYNVTLKDSGVTAGSKGDTTDQTPDFGETFKVLSATVDAKGRVTSLAEHSVRAPDAEATQSAKGLMSPADKTKLDTLIDSTLSGTGKAADAKATGDAITALESENTLLRELLRKAELDLTASGNPATFSDAKAANVKALSVTITPTQSGSGTPYPPGGGKNLIPMTLSAIKGGNTGGTWNGNNYTTRGVTFTIEPDSGGNVLGITMNGTFTGGTLMFFLGSIDFVANTTYLVNGAISNAANARIAIFQKNSDFGTGASYTPTEDEIERPIYILISSTTPISNLTFHPMIRRAAETDPTFAPYSNIRPISGVTSVTVTRTGTNGANAIQATVSTGQAGTVYGGTLDVTTGELTVTHGEYPSYNGETLPGVWLSDRDAYAPATTPTTGAQVVYELETPVTHTLTPVQIATLAGYNAVYADAGPVSVTYRADMSITLGGGM